MTTATEINKLRIDASMMFYLLTTAVGLAATFTALQWQVGAAVGDIATLRSSIERLSDFRERTIVLETRFASIDDRLARIEGAITGLAQRRAELEPPPLVVAPSRNPRR